MGRTYATRLTFPVAKAEAVMSALEILLLAGRLVLAAVFVVAAVTKLVDRPGARRALTDFGLPGTLAAPGAVALPLVELAAAAALLARPTARYGALGALALLLLFVAGVANSLRLGRKHDCHCFGQLYSKPIGSGTIVRNGMLGLIAAFVAGTGWGDPGPSLVAWLGPLAVAERAIILGGALGLALLAAQVALLTVLVRRTAGQQEAAPVARSGDVASVVEPIAATPAAPTVGLPVGAPAPAFALPDLQGETVALEALRATGRPTLLVFSDPACGACNQLLPDIGRWQRELTATLTVAIVGRGTPEMNRAKSSEHGLARVLLQRDRELLDAYRVAGTPSGVLVRPDGTIGSALAQGPEEIARLVAGVAPPLARPRPLPLVASAAPAANGQGSAVEPAAAPLPATIAPAVEGDPAPDFALPDLDGKTISLAHFRGAPLLILFWSPTCGYCQRMIEDLRTWAARPTEERARLLLVASGTAEENRAQQLPGTVLLDTGFTAAPRYGVTGTPSAIWVDGEGRIAAPVAVGVEAILELAAQSAPLPELTPTARPMKDECVEDELLPDGSIVLYSGCRQRVLTLNPTGALIWEYCDGEHDLATIVEEMRDVFPAAAAVEGDVRQLLDSLARAGMVGIAA